MLQVSTFTVDFYKKKKKKKAMSSVFVLQNSRGLASMMRVVKAKPMGTLTGQQKMEQSMPDPSACFN